MTSTLASTSFATGIDDKLASVDVYTQSSASTPINDSAIKLPDSYDEMLSLLGSDAVDPSTQLSGFNLEDGMSLSSTDLTTGVISQDSSLQTAYNSLDSNLKKILTSVKGHLQINITNKGITTNLNLHKLANVAAVATIVNVLGGNKSLLTVLDVAGKVAFISNVIALASKMRMPNVYAIITANIGELAVLTKITKNSLSIAVNTSDTTLLANIAFGSQGKLVRSLYANFCIDFATNFTLPTGTSANEYAAIGASISSSFARIDIYWNQYQTKDHGVFLGAKLLLVGSEDFRKVMHACSTRARRPWYAVTSAVTHAASDFVMPTYVKPGVITYRKIDSDGNDITRYVFPDGSEEHYTTDTSGAISYYTVTPSSMPTTQAGFADFDNSAIDDPLALGHVLATVSDQSTAAAEDACALNTNAAASLQAYFPYSPLSGLQDQDLDSGTA